MSAKFNCILFSLIVIENEHRQACVFVLIYRNYMTRLDGTYAIGCASQVTRYRNGNAFQMFCDNNLYYDSDGGGCVPMHLSICISNTGQFKEISNYGTRDCENKETGAYGYPNFHPCEREYFLCDITNQSHIIRKRCAEDEYFEKQTASCMKRLSYKICGVENGFQENTTSTEDTGESGNFVANFDTIIRSDVEVIVNSMDKGHVNFGFDNVPKCEKMGPVYFGLKANTDEEYDKYACSKYYWRCNNLTNLAEFLHCKENFVFDLNTTNCVNPSKLSACSEAHKPVSYFKPKQVDRVKYDECRSAEDKMIVMEDDCSSEYYICGKSEDILYRCPNGLQFDPIFRECYYPAECWLVTLAHFHLIVARAGESARRSRKNDYYRTNCVGTSALRAAAAGCPFVREELRLEIQAKFGLRNLAFPDSFAPKCDEVGPGYYSVKNREEGANYTCSRHYWRCKTPLSTAEHFVCTEIRPSSQLYEVVLAHTKRTSDI